MTYAVSLKLKPETYQRFQHIHQQLNAGEIESLSKALGAVLTDISCEIIEQLFGEMSRSSHSLDGESEKIIQQVIQTMQKYMPWSVSFFGITLNAYGELSGKHDGPAGRTSFCDLSCR